MAPLRKRYKPPLTLQGKLTEDFAAIQDQLDAEIRKCATFQDIACANQERCDELEQELKDKDAEIEEKDAGGHEGQDRHKDFEDMRKRHYEMKGIKGILG